MLTANLFLTLAACTFLLDTGSHACEVKREKQAKCEKVNIKAVASVFPVLKEYNVKTSSGFERD